MSSKADFDALYTGTPPWDIGRPQGSLRTVADAGGIRGRVLDAGCGTGEHALMAAALGLDATGIDGSPRAIDLARRKAGHRRPVPRRRRPGPRVSRRDLRHRDRQRPVPRLPR